MADGAIEQNQASTCIIIGMGNGQSQILRLETIIDKEGANEFPCRYNKLKLKNTLIMTLENINLISFFLEIKKLELKLIDTPKS